MVNIGKPDLRLDRPVTRRSYRRPTVVAVTVTVVVRVWIPDRPGALGAVASRIGAVRGDLVGIDILERGADRAIDELVVELPSQDLLPLLLREIGQVDGVDVEDVRSGGIERADPRLAALETVAVLVEERTVGGLGQALVQRAAHDFDADWVAVLAGDGAEVVAGIGEVPPGGWLAAFLAGGRSSELVATGAVGPDDLAWADLPRSSLSLVLGRAGRPFHARERQQLLALARVADIRWAELLVSAVG